MADTRPHLLPHQTFVLQADAFRKNQIVPGCLCNCPLAKCDNDSCGLLPQDLVLRNRALPEPGKLTANREDCGFLRHRCRCRLLTPEAYPRERLITGHTGGSHQESVSSGEERQPHMAAFCYNLFLHHFSQFMQ